MKKTLSMLAIFGLSLTAVIAFPKTNDAPLASQVMYNSVFHADGDYSASSDVKADVKVVAVKKPTVKPLAEKKEKKVADEKVAEKVEVEEDVCGFPELGNATAKYDAQLITVRKEFRYEVNEEFRVKVYVKNSGNMPWFSPDSECLGVRVYVGTTRNDSRESKFMDPDIEESDNSAVSKSTVRLDAGQMRVDPGEIASFTFWAKADENPSVYREYFAPYVQDGDYFRNAEFKVDVYTGVTNESASELRTKLLYAFNSMRVNDMTIEGKRSVEVDLSDQKMWLKLDDNIVREFIISSGAPSTPTPTGTFKIMLKNEVRIGHAAPHYIMPSFQMFTSGGAGLHALPSLGTDGGTFWTEARDHIGRPVSHGCVRMLPEDAAFAYEFTEVGDPINIHW